MPSKTVLTFESVDEILKYDGRFESLDEMLKTAVLSRSTIYYAVEDGSSF